jgi:hypothetical protein
MQNRPICFVIFSLMSAALSVRGQDAVTSTTTDEQEAEAKPVIVSATRTNIPVDQSSTSVSVINSEDLDQKQIERAGLPRRPRNEVYVSASYLWWKKLRTTVAAKFVSGRQEINFGGPKFRHRRLQLRQRRRGI